MIRIRLINEGRVVKQITSRLHEGVVLEQIKKYKDPYDTVQIVEGDLSEGAKDMLHHVAKKIVPAALAAGVALGGANSAQAQGGANPHYPGLNHSVGQHMADIFSPNYKEKLRQRDYHRNTERQVWNAQQDEIRKQRIADARAQARPAPGQQHTVYDQSRLSQDGKSYIIYGMDNKVRRIPVNGTEYMAGDSQRLPHYITSTGGVFYVRHPHMNESIRESAENKAEHDKGYSDASNGIAKNPYNPGSPAAAAYDAGQAAYKRHFNEDMAHDLDNLDEGWKEKLGAAALAGSLALGAAGNAMARVTPDGQGGYTGGKPVATQTAPAASQAVQPGATLPGKNLQAVDNIDGDKASGYTITQDGNSYDVKVVPKGSPTPRGGKMMKVTQAQVGERGIGNYVVYLLNNGTAYLYMGGVSEGYTVTRGIDKERYTERPGLEGPFSTRSGKVVYYDKKEGKYYDPETDFYIGHEDYAKMDESDPNATVGTIPSTGTSGGTGRTQFAPTGKTTNARFNKNGQIELDTEQEDDGSVNLDADAVDQLQKAGVKIKETDDDGRDKFYYQRNNIWRVMDGDDLVDEYKPERNEIVGAKKLLARYDDEGYDVDRVISPMGVVTYLYGKPVDEATISESDSPVASAIARRIMSQRLDLLQKYGPVKVTAAIDDVADFVGDTEEIGSSDVSAWVKQVEQSLAGMGESMNEGTDTLDGILSKFSADYAKFKAGGDIDENQDFFDALYDYYFDEMPYGVKKARDGDPYEWITDRLDQESGIAPVAEAEEDASPADQAAADKNIIMQIRKAADYEKPTRVELADGSESVIAPNIARQLLAKFEKMKPDSKALLQNTLNTAEGFKEILAYFGGGVREQAAARAGNIIQSALAEAGLSDIRARMDARRDPPPKLSANPNTPLPPVPPYVAPTKPAELKAGDIIGYRPKNAKMVPIKAKVLKLLSGDRAMVSVSSPTLIARNNDSPVITIGPLSNLDIQNPYKAIAKNESVVNEAAADWLPAYNGLVKGDGEPAKGGNSQNLNWKKSMALVAKDTGITDWNQLMNFVQQYASSGHNNASRENLDRWQQLTNEIASLMKQAPTMDEMRAAVKQQDTDKHQQNLTAIQQQLDLENAPLQHELSVQALINKAELDQADQKVLLELDMEARLAIVKIKQDLELDAKERLVAIEREIEDRKEREDVRKHELEMAQAGYKHELAVINATAEGEYKKAKLEADYQIQIKQLDNIDNAGERQNRLDQINTEKAKQIAVIDAETKARVEVMQKEVDVEKQQSDIKIEQAFMMTLNPIWGAALTAAHAAGSTWKAGINNLNKALAMLSKPVMPKPQKESRYDRRDAYQRDYDSSVAGMGKRQSLAYQQDGGANDEGWDQPERSYQAPQQTYYIRFKDSGKVYKQKGVPKSFASKAAANGYALAMIKNNSAHQGNLLLTVTGEDTPTA